MNQSGWLASRCSRVNEGDLKVGVPTGIRTRVSALKGPRPRPLDDGDLQRVAVGAPVRRRKHPILARLGVWIRKADRADISTDRCLVAAPA